jgi:hypothetical protein
MWGFRTARKPVQQVEVSNPLSAEDKTDAARTIQQFISHKQEAKKNDIHVLRPTIIVKEIVVFKRNVENFVFKICLFDDLKKDYEVRRSYKSFVALAEMSSLLFPDVGLLSVEKFER